MYSIIANGQPVSANVMPLARAPDVKDLCPRFLGEKTV